ncbi:MAG: hypothetical protein ACR2QC_06255 [Gammaproteobacteria bacterium]
MTRGRTAEFAEIRAETAGEIPAFAGMADLGGRQRRGTKRRRMMYNSRVLFANRGETS